MHVIIDGHNLIGKMADISLSDADDEAQLETKIRRYRARTGRRVTLYFDGGKTYRTGSTKKRGGLTIRYAPYGITADTLIIKQLRKVRNPKEVLVISSDREIQRAGRQVGANIMASEQFANLLDLPVTSAEDDGDVQLSDAEIDEWLSLFGREDD